MLRRLLVWIVLLALPLQGVASTSMVQCGPMHAIKVMASATDTLHYSAHHQRAARHHAQHAYAGDSAVDASDAEHSHASALSHDHEVAHGAHSHGVNGSADHDAPCCAAAFAMPPFASLLFPPPARSAATSYFAVTLPSVILEGLRRPPRSLAA